MKLIFKYLSMYFKSQLEYKSSFMLSFISQLCTISLSSFTVLILMDKFKFLNNYNIYQIILSISIVQFGFSFAECFGRGFDKFSSIIKDGLLDLILIKPRNIYIQIFGSNIELAKLSRVFASIILFLIALINLDFNKSLLNILYLISLLFFSTLIYLALYIFSACFCFKTIEGLEFINIFTDGSRDFSQYPMDLFNKPIKLFFTYIIPLACVNYYPITYLLNQSNKLIYLISPLFCIIIFTISILTFNKCINHYQSTGS